MINDLRPNTQYEFSVKLIKVSRGVIFQGVSYPISVYKSTAWIVLGSPREQMVHGRLQYNIWGHSIVGPERSHRCACREESNPREFELATS